MGIRISESDAELAACFPVMRQLRPELTLESFTAKVRAQARAGYRVAYAEVDGRPVAVAGFRVLETLVSRRLLNVDDLVTLDSERSRGHGSRLLRWLLDHARALGCDFLELDSGVQRKDAHRFYAREGLEVVAYHFAIRVATHGGGEA
jgi:GNAT superfamily N-acetyltransferase